MDSFLFSIQATAPVFLLMVLGYIFRRLCLLDEHFCKVSDKFVFTVALPVMLFRDMAATHLRETFDLPYVLFCAGVTIQMSYFLFRWSLWEWLHRQQMRGTISLKEFMKHLSCFYYICVLIFLSICSALQCFKISGTINKIHGHFWSSVF